jgi:hypothetical protein
MDHSKNSSSPISNEEQNGLQAGAIGAIASDID